MSKSTVNMCSENCYKMGIRVYSQDSAIRRNLRNSEIDEEWGNKAQRQFQTCRFRTTAGVNQGVGINRTHTLQLYLF